MNPLIQILDILKKEKKEIIVPLPSYWVYPENSPSGEIVKKNIYDCFIEIIESYILPAKKFFLKNYRPVIYGCFIRTTTAYDFDRDGKLSFLDKYGLKETGTILRMILLLPFLKKIGINTLYLLPITLPSEIYKKGEAPSPYSPKDFLKLDKYLYDPITGEFTEEKLELQFKAFVYACHFLGMKVFLDFMPRTAGRDNNLILNHPEWFYWIKKEYEKDFKPPYIPSLKMTSFFAKYTEKIYKQEETQQFLKKFTFSPDILDIEKWKKLVKKIKFYKIENFLPLIEEEFGITTVPGFSDVINDPQPIWKDITFLRLYFDHPNDALKYIPKNQPPYVLFDVIKASRTKFKKPNKKLWSYLSGIIPYYEKKFKIDGVRIDMGHALPKKLESLIIKRATEKQKNFFLIAEELDVRNSFSAKKSGYNALIGNLWYIQPRWRTGSIKKFFCNILPNLYLPIFASAETPDTPRSITRDGKEYFHLFVTALNCFLPNTIPFINSGFELKEVQPLNKGLDPEFCRLDLLPKKDLNYGKLGLFNFTSLHWNNNSEKIFNLLKYCIQIRSYYNEITKFNNFKKINVFPENKYTFSFSCNTKMGKLIFFVNSNLKRNYKIWFKEKNFSKIEVILDTFHYYKKEIFSSNIKVKYKKGRYYLKIFKGAIVILLLK